uniref:Uncharacterized protein n=1 Tax=Panagrolaimus sp. PS1159 TaxID=55785 RepID=A0AC35EUZ9_9BILA
MNNAIPQPPLAKAARVRNHSEAFGLDDETSAQHSPQYLQFFMDLIAQQSTQLGQQVILIQNLLHKIEMLEQENIKLSKNLINENIVSNSNLSIPKSKPISQNSTSNKKTYPKSVVVTNITESTETDEIKKAENDKKTIIGFIKQIDQTAVVDSVVRMGNINPEKNRPIRVNFKTSTQKQDVIKKAKDFIKANAEYSEKKIFVNNLVSKEEHKIQMNLKNKLKQLWKEAETNNSNIKFSIQNNQIHIHDPNAQNKNALLIDDTNTEAATFYKISSFRQQQKSIPESESAMETSSTV